MCLMCANRVPLFNFKRTKKKGIVSTHLTLTQKAQRTTFFIFEESIQGCAHTKQEEMVVEPRESVLLECGLRTSMRPSDKPNIKSKRNFFYDNGMTGVALLS